MDGVTSVLNPPVLECRSVGRTFGGVQALTDLSLAVRQREVVGVAGSNGAGKSTLFNVVAGALRPSSGEVWFDGERIDGERPDQVCKRGIARTFQTPPQAGEETVFQHVSLGAWYGRRGLRGVRGNRRVVEAQTWSALDAVGLDNHAERQLADLNHFDRKRAMLAAALSCGPKLLLLDELAAGLSPEEVDGLAGIVRSLAVSGLTLLVIEHLMSFLSGTVSRLVVMHEGRLLFEGTVAEVAASEAVVRTWLGGGTR
ncbi:MAG: ABC transporter ATP-binding protein [Solirubrobacterales bacterium]